MNFSTAEAYSSSDMNPLVDIRLIDLLLLSDEPIEGRLSSITLPNLSSYISAYIFDLIAFRFASSFEVITLDFFDCKPMYTPEKTCYFAESSLPPQQQQLSSRQQHKPQQSPFL